MRTDIHLQTAAGAAVALVLGAIVYLADRQAADVYLLPDALGSVLMEAPLNLHDSLPAFLHTFAFCLLTAGAVPLTAAAARSVCLGWWLVAVLLETAQHPTLANQLAAAVPDWLDVVPVLGALRGYLLNGTFDGWDIALAGLGCVCAWAAICHTIRENTPHD